MELWTLGGSTRFAVLFVLDLSTRRVEIVGIHPEPDSAWVVQRTRQLTDPDDGCLRGKRFLLHDRDARFTEAFADTLSAAGVETVRLPARSPNLNAYAERFVRTIKESCLDQLILVANGRFGPPFTSSFSTIITNATIKAGGTSCSSPSGSSFLLTGPWRVVRAWADC